MLHLQQAVLSQPANILKYVTKTLRLTYLTISKRSNDQDVFLQT